MRNVLSVGSDVCEGEFCKGSFYYHDIVEVELDPAVDFGWVEQLVVDYSDEAIEVVKLLLEFGMLTPHYIIKDCAITYITLQNNSMKINQHTQSREPLDLLAQLAKITPRQLTVLVVFDDSDRVVLLDRVVLEIFYV